jgi:hypothetical protein
MRRRVLLFALVGLALTVSCLRSQHRRSYRPSGTCASACDYYLSCKDKDDDRDAVRSCIIECRDVFSDKDSLRAFERLSCDEAIAYVEGPSGRTPGNH